MKHKLYKTFLKRIFAKIPLKYFQRIYPYAVTRQTFYGDLIKAKNFFRREDGYKNLFEDILYDKEVIYLEFGVWEGRSIKYISKLNNNPKSKFIGFDTFEGLPEDWTKGLKKGAFSTKGKMPLVDDQRIKFVKGLFQETLKEELKILDLNKNHTLVIHFDADLYSSTSYVLNSFRDYSYYAIFDEFLGDEALALYDFLRSNQCEIKWLSVVYDKIKYPLKTIGYIKNKQKLY